MLGRQSDNRQDELGAWVRDSRLRVLVIATTVPAKDGDGTPRFVLDLCRDVAEYAEVELISPRVVGGLAVERRGLLTIRRIPYFFQRWERLGSDAILPMLRKRPVLWLQAGLLSMALTVAAVCRGIVFKPHVIHAHWIVPNGLAALIATRVFRVPYIVTVHGADAFSLQGKIAVRFKRHVLRGADATVCVSKEIALRVGANLSDVRPMGVDVEDIARFARPTAERERTVLFVGRLVEKKGADVLIRAAPRLPNDVSVVIVGDGPEMSRLRELAMVEGVLERVEFVGQRGASEVYDHLGRAAVLVVPSRTASDGDADGTPVVVGEGFAAGVPVVGSGIGGIAELLANGRGVIVDPDSTEQLGRAVMLLMGDADKRDELGRRGREYAMAHLDRRGVRDHYVGIYRRVLECRP